MFAGRQRGKYGAAMPAYLGQRRRVYVEFGRSAGTPLIQILAPLSPPAQAAAWADMRAQLDAFSTHDGWIGPNELLLCGATRPG